MMASLQYLWLLSWVHFLFTILKVASINDIDFITSGVQVIGRPIVQIIVSISHCMQSVIRYHKVAICFSGSNDVIKISYKYYLGSSVLRAYNWSKCELLINYCSREGIRKKKKCIKSLPSDSAGAGSQVCRGGLALILPWYMQ